MKKFFKGIFIIISILCIAFTGFFVYSYASGNTVPITKIEAGIIKVLGTKTTGAKGAGGSQGTVNMLTNDYGLSTKQAERVVEMAQDIGIDTSNPAEMSTFIAKNAGNADRVKEIAAAVQSGMMTESQAKAELAKVLNV